MLIAVNHKCNTANINPTGHLYIKIRLCSVGLFLLIAGCLLLTTAVAQKPITGCPKVIFYSSQLLDSICDSSIKKIGVAFFSGKIFVKHQDNSKNIVQADSVWGIRKSDDYPLRLYDGRYYSLYELSPVYKYKTLGKYSKYYFSSTLDSPVYSFSREQLKLHTDSATYNIIAKSTAKCRHDIALDFYAYGTKIALNDLWGLALEMRYFPTKKFSTGLYLAGVQKKITDTFLFSVIKPQVSSLDIGWINQYDLVQNKNIRLGANLITALTISMLRDKAFTERVRTSRGYRNVSKKIAENYQFLLEPGLDLSVKLISNNHEPDFYLTGKTRYRWAIGSTEFGSASMFSSFSFGLGIALIGFDREQL